MGERRDPAATWGVGRNEGSPNDEVVLSGRRNLVGQDEAGELTGRFEGESWSKRPAWRWAAWPVSGGANVVRARTLGALLDLELDALATGETIEVEGCVEGAAMEEVLLLILGCDEAEASIGDDALDGTGGHDDLQDFPNSDWRRTVRSRRRSTTRCITTRGGDVSP